MPQSYRDCDDARRDLKIAVDCCSNCHNEWMFGRGEFEAQRMGPHLYIVCCNLQPNLTNEPA